MILKNEKTFFMNLMNNAFLEKLWNIKLFKIERRKTFLVSEPNYHTTMFFTEYILAVEMKKHRYL